MKRFLKLAMLITYLGLSGCATDPEPQANLEKTVNLPQVHRRAQPIPNFWDQPSSFETSKEIKASVEPIQSSPYPTLRSDSTLPFVGTLISFLAILILMAAFTYFRPRGRSFWVEISVAVALVALISFYVITSSFVVGILLILLVGALVGTTFTTAFQNKKNFKQSIPSTNDPLPAPSPSLPGLTRERGSISISRNSEDPVVKKLS